MQKRKTLEEFKNAKNSEKRIQSTLAKISEKKTPGELGGGIPRNHWSSS